VEGWVLRREGDGPAPFGSGAASQAPVRTPARTPRDRGPSPLFSCCSEPCSERTGRGSPKIPPGRLVVTPAAVVDVSALLGYDPHARGGALPALGMVEGT